MDIRLLSFFLDFTVVYLSFGLLSASQFALFSPGFFRQQAVIAGFVLVHIGCLAFANLYENRFRSHSLILRRTFFGMLAALLISMGLAYVLRSYVSIPEWVFPLVFLAGLTVLFLIRASLYRSRGRIYKKEVFVGDKDLPSIDSFLEKGEIDEIVLTTKNADMSALYKIFAIAGLKQAKVSVLPKFYDEMLAQNINGNGKHLFILPPYFQNYSEGKLIRAFDIVCAGMLLFFSLPVMLILAVLIKMDSLFAPVIFMQERVGLNGRLFWLYKFRSMIPDAGQFSRPRDIPLKRDRRVTRIGRSMRKMHLDELPQLFNVIKGDMSLVGPRPEALYRVREHRVLQGIRLSVRPGLTGLAQVEGDYHTSPRHKLHYDYVYIRNRSLLLNLNLLLRTALVIFRRVGS